MTENRKRLFKGAHVISLDDEIGELDRGDVLVDDQGVIVQVAEEIAADDVEVVDCSDQIMFPGFHDTHRHTWQTPMRSIGTDFVGPEYRSCIRGTVGPHVRPEDVYWGTLAGALEALDGGVTTLVDWAHVMNSPEHADASIDALQEAGLRAVFGFGTPNDAETVSWYKNSDRPHPEHVRSLREGRLNSDDGLITLALAVRPPHTVTPEVMIHDWKLARELGVRITTDGGLGGGTWTGVIWGEGGHQPMKDLDDAGLLGPDTTYVHCNNLPDSELRMIAESGGSISISPDAEMHVGHCLPVTGRAVAAGVRPALSTDITIQVGGDMFGAMRSILSVERGRVGAEAYSQGFAPNRWDLRSKDVLEFATIEGARASGLEDRTGTISPGKAADLVLIDANSWNLFPMNNAIGLVVLQAHVGNIDTVVVNGKIVKQDGELLGVDRQKVRAGVEQTRDHLFQSAGLEVGYDFDPGEPGFQWLW